MGNVLAVVHGPYQVSFLNNIERTQLVESQELTVRLPYSIGNAKTAGMTDDLDMDSTKYSIALTVFFVGYVVFEVPSNMILARTKPSVFLPTIMFLWGCVTIAMAWVPNYKALIGLRIVVGVLEAGFAPGVLLTLSSWYKPNEQAKRFGVYISAAILSGAFGGLIAGAIEDGLDGVHGLPGWKWLFIVSFYKATSSNEHFAF